MSESLLVTKLNVPRLRSESVQRLHLLERLEAGRRRCKLSLISAPAGFGKTTLVTQWHAWQPAGEQHLSWVRLDDGDNDPVRFWRYVLAALHRALPGLSDRVGEALHALATGISSADVENRPLQGVVMALVNELQSAEGDGSSVAERPLVIALDDFHVIHAPAVHHSLAYFLEYLPEGVHVVILTRADPPLPLARLRACDQLLELRGADLRFTCGEVDLFLNRLMALNLPAAAVSTLSARTEGWVAGLQFAALSLQRLDPQQAQSFVEAFAGTHRHVLSFLAEEVVQRQPPDVQAFLAETSILEYLTPPLCEAVTGRTGSRTMLERLTIDNLFVTPLDLEGRWYRYHPLFADMLRAQLEESFPDRLPVLHGRASAWHETHGTLSCAVRHALASGDCGRAARLVEDGYQRLAMNGELATLHHWLDALPAALVEMRPRLRRAYALALAYSGRRHLLETSLQETEEALLSAEPGEADATRCETAALRAVFASLYWIGPRSLDLARRALRLLPADRSDDTLWLRVLTVQAMGNCYRLQGQLREAEQSYSESLPVAQALQSSFLVEAVTNRLGQNAFLQGRLRRAARIFEAALNKAEGRGGLLWFTGELSIHLGTIYTEWDDLEKAAHHVEQGIEISRQVKNELALLEGYLALAEVKSAQRQARSAALALDKAWQIGLDAGGLYLLALVAARRAWLDLAAEGHGMSGPDVARWAEAWAGRRAQTPDHELPLALCEFQDLVLARFWLVKGRPDKAVELLAEIEDAARPAGRMGTALPALVWSAAALERQGALAQAGDALMRALTLAMPEGYVRTFVNAGSAVQSMLAEFRCSMAGADEAFPELLTYLDRVLGAFPQPAAAGAGKHNGLTCREMELLTLMAGGASNQEIAHQLVVTVGTVKVHVNHILGKLQVHNRTAAVARARELRLL